MIRGQNEINRRMNLNLQLSNQIDRCEEVLEGRKKNREELGLNERKNRAVETQETSGMTTQMLYDDHKSKLERMISDFIVYSTMKIFRKQQGFGKDS